MTGLLTAPVNESPVDPAHSLVPLQGRTGPGEVFQEILISETGGLLIAPKAVAWSKYTINASETVVISNSSAVVYGAQLGSDPGSILIQLINGMASELPLRLEPYNPFVPALFETGLSITSGALVTPVDVFVQWAPAA